LLRRALGAAGAASSAGISLPTTAPPVVAAPTAAVAVAVVAEANA